jgi:putative transposase
VQLQLLGEAQRTIKEELFWLREWKGEAELSKELDKWVQYYNSSYLHSAHGYRTPIQAEEEYHKNHTSHKNATRLFLVGQYTYLSHM